MIFQIDTNAPKRGLKKVLTDCIRGNLLTDVFYVGRERFSNSGFAVNYLAKIIGIPIAGPAKYTYTLTHSAANLYMVDFFLVENEEECDVKIAATDVDIFPHVRPRTLAGSPFTEI